MGYEREDGAGFLGKKDEQIFLGRDMAHSKNYSEATAVDIDIEIKRIVEENYNRVRTLLSDNLDVLHRLSTLLIEKENLTGAEVDEIIADTSGSAAAPASEETAS